jgi:hypothetical protein
MSWDAYLEVPGVPWAGRDWNYTHNTNRMVNVALGAAGVEVVDTWWKMLNGMTGAEGLELLTKVVEQWDANPDFYRAMNPDNGWGSLDDPEYGGIRSVFAEMIEAATVEHPLRWWVHG